MKVEIFTNNKFKNIVKSQGITATRTYRRNVNNTPPYYEVWEVEKSDVKNLEMSCLTEGVFFCYSIGEHRGTAYDFININGVGVIAWQEDCKKDNFDNLTDYFKECLGVTDAWQMAAYSVYLAKTNGWSLATLWSKLES
jgi:hypothetical protein